MKAESKLKSLLKTIPDGRSPEWYMRKMLQALHGRQKKIPTVGKSYLFIYEAIDQGVYDKHPLITVTYIDKHGFCGLSHHWNKPRRYSWRGVQSALYELKDDELNSAVQFPCARYTRRW